MLKQLRKIGNNSSNNINKNINSINNNNQKTLVEYKPKFNNAKLLFSGQNFSDD